MTSLTEVLYIALVFILCVWLCKPTDGTSSFPLLSYHLESNKTSGVFNQVAVHINHGYVYVATRNRVYKLTSNLTYINHFTTGRWWWCVVFFIINLDSFCI